MHDRREFLKRAALLGTLVAMPIPRTLAQEASGTPAPNASEASYTVQMRQVNKRPMPPRNIMIPDVEGFKVLKGDFHMHTLFSDGYVMPKERVAEAVDNGLDVIAITDHIEYRPFFGGRGWPLKEKNDDHNISYEIAKPEADKRHLILVRGTEITKSKMPPGHFNALFLEDVNPVAAAVDDWKKMLSVAAEQGAFLLWNHPGWASASGGLPKGAPLAFTPEHEWAVKEKLMHGIEVFNSSEYYPIVSDWCNERDLALFANSDIHQSEWNEYGHQNPLRPLTLVLAKERTHASIKEAFFARRTIGWAAGLLFGRDPWLGALFASCVEVKQEPGKLLLTNRSDIPCALRAGGAVRELEPQGTLEMYRAPGVDRLTVENWIVAAGKPLDVALA